MTLHFPSQDYHLHRQGERIETVGVTCVPTKGGVFYRGAFQDWYLAKRSAAAQGEKWEEATARLFVKITQGTNTLLSVKREYTDFDLFNREKKSDLFVKFLVQLEDKFEFFPSSGLPCEAEVQF